MMQRRFEQGFSLVEIAVVLVVIGIIIGMVSVGKDVQRSAVNLRIANSFMQGWIQAYTQYYQSNGIPGDTPGAPTGCVGASCARASGSSYKAGNPLCDTASSYDLRNVMLRAGIVLPKGRAEGQESRYVYLDSNGLPQELQVCFINDFWDEPAPATGTKINQTVKRRRNLMEIRGVTPALGNYLDQFLDNYIDPQKGDFRCKDCVPATEWGSEVESKVRAVGDGSGGETVEIAQDHALAPTRTVRIKMPF